MFEMAEIKIEKFELVDVITTSEEDVNIPDMTDLG